MPLADDLQPSVRVVAVATTNVVIATALVPGQVLGGRTLVAGDLVLLAGQTGSITNGLYRAGAVPARDVNYSSTAEGGKFGANGAYDLFPGMIVSVEQTGVMYRCTSVRGGALGTNTLVFAAMNTSLEEIQDIVGAMFSGNTETGLAATYDDPTGKINFNVTCLAPGTVHNGKLVATRSANAETLTLQTVAGAAPTAADPVIWIGPTGTRVNITATVSLVISSGSTLGMANGVASNLHFALVNDAGTFRIAVLNASDANGWTRFPPGGVLSATAEGGAGAADSVKTIYSNAAISAKEYAHLGFMTYTLATAGTWVTAPSLSMFGPNAPRPGDVLQVVYNRPGGTVNVTSGTYVVMANKNVAITPLMAASIIRLEGNCLVVRNGNLCLSNATWCRGTVNNTNAVGQQAFAQSDGAAGAVRDLMSIHALDKPNTTSSQTYTFQGSMNFGSSIDYVDGSYMATEYMG